MFASLSYKLLSLVSPTGRRINGGIAGRIAVRVQDEIPAARRSLGFHEETPAIVGHLSKLRKARGETYSECYPDYIPEYSEICPRDFAWDSANRYAENQRRTATSLSRSAASVYRDIRTDVNPCSCYWTPRERSRICTHRWSEFPQLGEHLRLVPRFSFTRTNLC